MHWRGHVLRSKIHCVLSWKIIYSRHNLHNKYSLTSSFSPTTFAFFTRPVDPNLVSNGGWWVSSRALSPNFHLECHSALAVYTNVHLECNCALLLCDVHLDYQSALMHCNVQLDYHCALRYPPGVRLCTVMLCGTLSVWVTDLPDTADQMWQYVMYRFLTIIYFRISSSSPTSTPHVRLIKLETKFHEDFTITEKAPMRAFS